MQICHKAKILHPPSQQVVQQPEALAKEVPRDPEKTWTVQTQEAAPSVLGQMLPTQQILSETRWLIELVLTHLKRNKEVSKGRAFPNLSPPE